jgi:hypothetical protein
MIFDPAWRSNFYRHVMSLREVKAYFTCLTFPWKFTRMTPVSPALFGRPARVCSWGKLDALRGNYFSGALEKTTSVGPCGETPKKLWKSETPLLYELKFKYHKPLYSSGECYWMALCPMDHLQE